MRKHLTLAISCLGVAALAGGSVFSDAMASHPPSLRLLSRIEAKNQTVKGDLTVNNRLKVSKSSSMYGKTYLHGGLEVWQGLTMKSGGITTGSLDVTGPQGLTVHSGGLRTDSLVVTGGMSAQSATIASNLQAVALGGSTLSITGDGTIGGSATTGALTAASITDNGKLSAAGISTTGALNAGQTTVTGLTVNGNLDLTHANLIGTIDLNGRTFTQATFQALNVGLPSSNVGPLNVSENGHTSQIGVNSGGQLSVDGGIVAGGNSSIGGDLTVSGPNGVAAAILQGPASSGGPGPLSIQGSAITLSGPTNIGGKTTITGGNDLVLSADSGAGKASHVLASGDTDLAGTVTLAVPLGTTPPTGITSPTVTFVKPFDTAPVITVTPTMDPQPNPAGTPKFWVELIGPNGAHQYTGFMIHYVPSGPTTAAFSVTFGYQIIAS